MYVSYSFFLNMIKFSEAVTIEEVSCRNCISFIYTLPCHLDETIVNYMMDIGNLVYPLGSIRLLKIRSNDGLVIEGKLNKNLLRLEIPKHLSSENKISRKSEFDIRLTNWIIDKLGINITLE